MLKLITWRNFPPSSGFHLRARCARANCEKGFTLVEVLCALAIAALAMVVLLRALTQSTTAGAYMDNHFAASLLAQSLIEDAAQSPLTGTFDRTGTSGTFQWQLSVEGAGPATAKLAPRGFALYELTVRVRWAPRGLVELSTIALGK